MIPHTVLFVVLRRRRVASLFVMVCGAPSSHGTPVLTIQLLHSPIRFLCTRRSPHSKGQHEWQDWYKSSARPLNIPTHPDRVYKDDGYISYPDWLGYQGRAVNKMLPYLMARTIVHSQHLRGKKEWYEWSKSGKRPANIPAGPWR